MAQVQQRYEELIAEWQSKPLGGVHTIGELTVTVTTRLWSMRQGDYLVASGNTKSAKETRATITRHIMRWVAKQA